MIALSEIQAATSIADLITPHIGALTQLDKSELIRKLELYAAARIDDAIAEHKHSDEAARLAAVLRLAEVAAVGGARLQYSLDEAAYMLCISTSRLKDLKRAGIIKQRHEGTRVMFTHTELIRYVKEEHRNPPPRGRKEPPQGKQTKT